MNVTVHDSVHVNVHSNVHVNDYGTVHTIIFSSLLLSVLKAPTPNVDNSQRGFEHDRA